MINVIYHSRDLDGFVSGAIVRMAAEEQNSQVNLIGYDYGQEFHYKKLYPKKQTVMIDVSLPIHDMFELFDFSGNQLTWIDHHISAINDFKVASPVFTEGIDAILNEKIAACEIAWLHYFPNRPMPLAIELLGMYDTWRNESTDYWKTDILPFQYGMRLHCTSPETFPYNVLTNNQYVREIMEEGRNILKYQSGIDKAAMSLAFEIDFHGYRAICVNRSGMNSIAFKSIYDETKHDLMMPFWFNGKFWTFSIYTTKEIDCSELAKLHGGEGHVKSSGFQIDDHNKIIGKAPITNGLTELLTDIKTQFGYPASMPKNTSVKALVERIDNALIK